MARKILIPDDEKEANAASASLLAYGNTKFSAVTFVHPSVLKPNPLNKELFTTSEHDFARIKADITEHGITTALHVLRTNVVLAGHTRLRAAMELGLKQIPVQYIETPMTDDEQRKYLIRDNLLRRHLSNDDRITLYQMLYPDFDATFLLEESRVRQGRTKKGDDRLTIAKIAQETGQAVNTVKSHIHRAKTDKKKVALQPFPNNKDSERESPSAIAQKYLLKVKQLAETMNKEEREKTRRYLEIVLSTL